MAIRYEITTKFSAPNYIMLHKKITCEHKNKLYKCIFYRLLWIRSESEWIE